MIQLYGSMQSSAGRCFWTLEEVGVPYEVINVNLREGEQKKPEYLALNPNGKVPTLRDGEFVLWESYAIDFYLAEKYKPEFLGSSLEEKALVQQWSFWSLLHLQKYFEVMLYFNLFQVGDEAGVQKAGQDVVKYLVILENHLQGKEYMVGNIFTLADIHVASAVNIGLGVHYDMSAYRNVLAWVEKMKSRPALQKLMSEKSA